MSWGRLEREGLEDEGGLDKSVVDGQVFFTVTPTFIDVCLLCLLTGSKSSE